MNAHTCSMRHPTCAKPMKILLERLAGDRERSTLNQWHDGCWTAIFWNYGLNFRPETYGYQWLSGFYRKIKFEFPILYHMIYLIYMMLFFLLGRMFQLHLGLHMWAIMCVYSVALRISNWAGDTLAGSSMVEKVHRATGLTGALRSPTLWLFFILLGLFYIQRPFKNVLKHQAQK